LTSGPTIPILSDPVHHAWTPVAPPASIAVGIVGAGKIARELHLPVLCAMTEVRVAWIADIDVARAAGACAALGLRVPAVEAHADRLPAADVVLLATPVGVRVPYYDALARQGAAVFAEKPFATTEAEHRRVIAAFPGHRIGCGYMRRTYAASRIVHAVVASGALGRPLEAIVREGGRTGSTGTSGSFLDDARMGGGGALADLGSHTLDLIAHLVHAGDAEVLEAVVTRDGAVDRKTSCRVRLSTPAGDVLLDHVVSWLDRQPNTIELRFERSSLRWSISADARVDMLDAHGSAVAVLGSAEIWPTTTYQAFFAEWHLFLQGLQEAHPSLLSASDCVLTTAMVERIYARGAAAGS
jgi:predicted dehydrogenase